MFGPKRRPRAGSRTGKARPRAGNRTGKARTNAGSRTRAGSSTRAGSRPAFPSRDSRPEAESRPSSESSKTRTCGPRAGPRRGARQRFLARTRRRPAPAGPEMGIRSGSAPAGAEPAPAGPVHCSCSPETGILLSMPGRLARGGRGRAGYLLADRRCARPPAGRRSLGTLSSRWPSRPRGDPASLRVRATFGRPGGLRRLKRRFHKEMYFLLTINNRNRRFGRPGGLRRPCRRVIAQGLVADLAVMISLCQDDHRGMRSSQVSAGGGMTPGW